MEQHVNRPAGILLETWIAHDRATGLQTEHLSERQSITVETENSRYELTIVRGGTGDVLVRGGEFFPEETAARLAGSCSLGGALLKLRGIYIGFRMELHSHEWAIITSPVRSIGLMPGLDGAPLQPFR